MTLTTFFLGGLVIVFTTFWIWSAVPRKALPPTQQDDELGSF